MGLKEHRPIIEPIELDFDYYILQLAKYICVILVRQSE